MSWNSQFLERWRILWLGFCLNRCLKLRQVMLAKFRNLGLDHNLAVGISPVSLIEFLMIIFSRVKCFEGNDLSDDRILPNLGPLLLFDNPLGRFSLLLIMIEYH